MKLFIDTNNCETIHLEMTNEEKNAHFAENAKELSFGLAGLAVDYIQQMDRAFDSGNYHKVRELLVKLFDSYLEEMIDEVLVDDNEDEVDEDEIENLRVMMEESGSFTEEEIDTAVKLLIDAGSTENAITYLKSVARENNISLDE